MNNIKMKIKGYDKENHSLLVSFACDETRSQNPDDYEPIAFQTATMWPGITDVEEIKLKIAEVGKSILQQQITKESIGGDPIKQIELNKMVGMTFEFNASDFEPEDDYPVTEV